MKNNLIITILIIFLTNISCKETDSKNLKKPNYKSIIKRLSIQGNWRESNEIAKIQLRQSKNIPNDDLFYYLILGENYRFLEKYNLSDYYFRQVIIHQKSNKFPEYLGEAYYGLGDLYYLKWNYFKEKDALNDAKMYLDSSMTYAKKGSYPALESKNLYRLGTILQIQGNKEESESNFKRGLKISFSIADTVGVIRNDTHKASQFKHSGILDSALFHYQRAYKYAKHQNRNYSEAHALCNLGWYYFDKGEMEVAERYFYNAKFLSEELNQGLILCRSYYSLSRLYTVLEQKETAKKYTEMGLEIATKKGYKIYEQAFNK